MATQAHDERSLSQRELRNESARVLREVAEGRSFVITNRSRPVARLVPVDVDEPKLRVSRPARRQGGWTLPDRQGGSSGRSVEEILDELREDRV
ncbi:type II toxin-antitoxin system Phd/YefM family antitoxin [Rothia kristinae]|uniref:Antitoxin n=1 Tax=Rothia kristinae TaxID=37923 RepID=A0A1S2MZS4_9MICC|nr:type II toxin-antitoxin system prevent-host-death family antitoxin [Rothia kristinae]MBE8526168.1 type II toxin-antitoxin system prevent-host-death family antitoxin [Amycolatopsis sp. H6(2020)]MDN5639675.1 type II toxin-antitoxin system prevent-host-death family antitoxin [Actinomycetes bacterium]OIJ35822.1 prevent-host-death family protein [Rothia kristinae]QQC60165.1 type II toxin-antitoxin system prevent-host-death family antitoxin [Rothia kristinae]